MRLFLDSSSLRGQGPSEFDPEAFRGMLDRLSTLMGERLRLREDKAHRDPQRPFIPVRIGSSRTGWGIVADDLNQHSVQAVRAAAEVISKVFTAEQDISSLAMEVADRYEELNFLYEMSARVGALLDEEEICDFVVNEAAWLMNCERASIMVSDLQTGE
ncbi:MAG: hypothetical protein ACYS8L_07740, partial [Planctomycetota bacterium]